MIDFIKGSSFIVILFLIHWYDQYSNATIWVYFGIHGSYGVLWYLKGIFLPDKTFFRFRPYYFFLSDASGLYLYLSPAVIIASRSQENPPWLLGVSVFM